jgi:uncharacterized phage infection (PIP) family protein YhgE
MSTKTLQEQRDELQEKVDALQIEAAERKFEIQFNDRKMVKIVMDHLNKGYTWKTANAAVIVTLYDQLKQQNKELTNSDSEETVISLRGHELNALYQALLNVEGQGVENARRFITMLTHVGETVSNAMTELADMNKEINDMHTQLDEIYRQIEAEGVESVDPELVEADAEQTNA